MVTFGKETRVRFIGGEVITRVDGIKDAVLRLDRMVAWSSNLSNPFQRFQKHWFAAIDAHFQKEANTPTEWPALSDAYAGWKEANYPGRPIMRLSDTLYESLTNQTSNTIWQVGPRSIQFGTRVPYFDYHQEARGNNPLRQTLVLPPEAQAKLVQMIENYIMTGKAE